MLSKLDLNRIAQLSNHCCCTQKQPDYIHTAIPHLQSSFRLEINVVSYKYNINNKSLQNCLLLYEKHNENQNYIGMKQVLNITYYYVLFSWGSSSYQRPTFQCLCSPNFSSRIKRFQFICSPWQSFHTSDIPSTPSSKRPMVSEGKNYLVTQYFVCSKSQKSI